LGIPATGARIYANKQLIIIASEYTIKETSIQHDLTQLIIDFAISHKAAAILTMEALSGDPSEQTTLLEQIQLSAEPNSEDGGLGDEDDEDFDGYSDSYSINSPGDLSNQLDPIIKLSKNSKKNTIK